MPFNCYICKLLIPGDVRNLFTHLRSVHFVCELSGVTLKCGQGDCVRWYSTFHSLARHLHDQHSCQNAAASRLMSADDDHGSGNAGGGSVHCNINETAEASAGLLRRPTMPVVVRDKNSAAATFVSSLLSSTTVTQKTVQTVIEHTATLVDNIVTDICSDVANSLEAANAPSSIDYGLLDRLQQFRNPFDGLNTQRNRDTYIRNHYGMVTARTMFLGNRYDQTLDRATGSMRQVIKRDTFQYVPILQLLGLLLSDCSILNETAVNHMSLDGVMHDFCDGSLYKTIPLFIADKTALQLCVYFDECEVVNPLGSRRGIHKIGFIYLSLRNVRPMFNSRLSNMHVVAAFSSIDRSKYGFSKILAPIVNDIKKLEQGVELKLRDGTLIHKRGTVVQLAGDNLGLNQLCGFVESFSALHFCRLCMINRDDCVHTYRDDDLQLRNKEQYSQQLASVMDGTLATRDCGIKSDCSLNSLQYFHLTENVTVDIMHDLLEGIVPCELKLILSSFIFDRKYFTLQFLNARISSFDYGCSDRRNKPTALSDAELRDQQKTGLNQKASQTLCLVSVLSFLIGDVIPEDDRMWHLYLLLRKILDIVFADTCTVSDSICLKHIIEDHHTLFRAVFPDKQLLPKHHILLHYPHVMRQVGPLSRCSSIRFEAKHNESKRLCGIVCCFKDICKTVVYRHQLRQCMRIAAGNCAAYEVKVGKAESTVVNELPEADHILSAVDGLQRFDDISVATCVDVCGTEYRKNMVLVVGFGDEPTFCQIVKCLHITDNMVYFVCQELQVTFYDHHLHAFLVAHGQGVRVIAHRALQCYKPLCIRQTFDSCNEYVAIL